MFILSTFLRLTYIEFGTRRSFLMRAILIPTIIYYTKKIKRHGFLWNKIITILFNPHSNRQNMKPQKLTLLLSILGILLLIFLSQTKPAQTAIVESIQTSSSKITIKLQNHTTQLIIFETPNLNLTKGDKIRFQGKEGIYKNNKQIIINKISKIK